MMISSDVRKVLNLVALSVLVNLPVLSAKQKPRLLMSSYDVLTNRQHRFMVVIITNTQPRLLTRLSCRSQLKNKLSSLLSFSTNRQRGY